MTALLDHGPPPPCPARFNLAAHVLNAAARQPDKVALAVIGLSGAERWSYARLEAAVRGTATGLLEAGLAPGDRVLMRLGNTVEFPLAYLGAIAAGLVPVPTSPQLTAPEVAGIIATTTPRLILRGDGIACPETDLPVLGEAALLALRARPQADWHMGDPHRLAYVIQTSGTSGVPRAVMHAHRAILGREMMHQGWYGLSADDRLCHAGAFNWTFTLGTGLLDPWRAGATALIPGPEVTPAQLPLLLGAMTRRSLPRRRASFARCWTAAPCRRCRGCATGWPRAKSCRRHPRALGGGHRHRDPRGLRPLGMLDLRLGEPRSPRRPRHARPAAARPPRGHHRPGRRAGGLRRGGHHRRAQRAIRA